MPEVGDVYEGEGITVTLVASPNRRRPGYEDMWLCRLTKVGGLTYVPEDRFGTRLKKVEPSGVRRGDGRG